MFVVLPQLVTDTDRTRLTLNQSSRLTEWNVSSSLPAATKFGSSLQHFIIVLPSQSAVHQQMNQNINFQTQPHSSALP